MKDAVLNATSLKELPQADAEKFIVKELFDVNESGIMFREELGINPDDTTAIHSPLAHLYRFMSDWGSLIPPDYTTIRKQWSATQVTRDLTTTTSPFFNPNDPIYVDPKMRGNPADIFRSLVVHDAVTKKKKLGKEQTALDLVTSQLHNAQYVDLFGAIGLPSVVNVHAFLDQNNFQGRLRVYDISSVPVEIGRKYQKLGLLPANMDFFQTSVLELSHQYIQEESSSLVLADVLGYYLSDEEYELMTEYAQMALRQKGLLLIRDLIEPMGIPSIEQRTVGGIDTNRFTEFIADILPSVNVSQGLTDALPKILRWPIPNSRQLIDEYWGPVAGQFDLCANVRMTPSPDCQRVFVT